MVVPAGNKGAINGSVPPPDVKLTNAPSGPAQAAAWPFVNTMPLLMASGVPTEVNVPLATPGHVNTGFSMVTPGPASVDAKVAADAAVVTVSWE